MLFGTFLLASSELNSKSYSPPSKQKEYFALVTKEQILSINEMAVSKNTKTATKFGLTVFNGRLLNLSKLKNFKPKKS